METITTGRTTTLNSPVVTGMLAVAMGTGAIIAMGASAITGANNAKSVKVSGTAMKKETDSAKTALSDTVGCLQFREVVSTDMIVQELLAQGLSMNDIVMPGGAKGLLTYVAKDFDAPLDDFEEYM